MIVGIDLGTTNSAIGAVIDGDPSLIPNALGEVLTPSVVGIDPKGTIVVGAEAAELQVTQPERCASLFKRAMGTDRTYSLADKKLTPIELSGLVLQRLREDAESHLGKQVENAVITVPAYFNENQRRATICAGELAGLRVERIINEPTSAAIAYGLHDSQTERVCVIFDLGGGTFDVSVVDHFEGVVEVRASSGECFLGGEDFSAAIVSGVLQQRGLMLEQAEMKTPAMVSRLRHLCELAKRELSTKVKATVRMPERDGSILAEAEVIEISLEDFRRWTEKTVARLERPVRKALGDAQLNRFDIDSVVLVGGATRMPMVKEYVSRNFECSIDSRLNPDEVVAIGATIQAGLIARDEAVDDIVVTDVAPFTLGVETTKQFGAELREGYFSPIIERNTTIPVSRSSVFQTVAANQAEMNISIYQGESRMVKDNLYLGEFRVVGIPPGPAGESVSMRFTYDLNGVLEAEATVLTTGQKFRHVVTRLAEGLTEDQIAVALEQMQELKKDPRDDQVNRFMLRRAERLYSQLDLQARDYLGQVLDLFEMALESRDPTQIEEARNRLGSFLDKVEPPDSNDWSADG